MKRYTTSQRLKEIMNLKGIKQIDILNKAQPICKKWGVKMGSNDLSQYVTGKVEPSQKKLSVLAETLDTNEVWLMGYDVPIDKNFEGVTYDDDLNKFCFRFNNEPDYSDKNNNDFDELEILFSKNKNILTDDDKEYIKFIIEKRKKEIDKELGKE